MSEPSLPSSTTSNPGALRRLGYLARASVLAAFLGLLELLQSKRGRARLALVALVGGGAAILLFHPLRVVPPGEVVFRTNRLSGRVTELHEGLCVRLPGVHDLRRFSLREQLYRPRGSASANGTTPFQTVEGLSIGVDVTVRYALDPGRLQEVARRLPEDVGAELVEPVTDGILHRTFARYTVREVYAQKRAEIEKELGAELAEALRGDGVLVRQVALGAVDLPEQYRKGLEALLAEELASEKMRFTLELKEKHVKESELEAEADRVRRGKLAEAQALEEVIAARAKEEAMRHVLPFKEKEIEQRRLEAEATRVSRLKQAEGEADARRLESAGEADARRKLADAEAYRLEVTGKAATEQLARDSVLIARNPLLIQKAVADKLSDKIQVIVAPPQAGGFFAGGLLGAKAAKADAPPESHVDPADREAKRSDEIEDN